MSKTKIRELIREFENLVKSGEVTDIYDYCGEKGLSDEECAELMAAGGI